MDHETCFHCFLTGLFLGAAAMAVIALIARPRESKPNEPKPLEDHDSYKPEPPRQTRRTMWD